MSSPAKLTALRDLLAERFPSAPRVEGRVLRTGLPALDKVAGGLPLGAVTEIACAAPSCGSQLLFGQILAATRAIGLRVALVDPVNSFDPESFPPDVLAHLLWIRCRTTSEALLSADLLARDSNLGLVLLDLRHAPAAELRRIPGSQWYRFQRAVESTDLAFIVQTPRPCVASAQLRFILNTSHSPAALATERPALSLALQPDLHRQRLPAALAS